ncbi:Neuroligin-1 [Eumeta japonica]|uniref:Neuroligin-1 n=1 Tax=Eumeta variegata TaxID=151549 RepID=A0A4C1XQ76_EUMVA|nr:Neuroligin-1 [Eumeta japonica]
MSVLSAGARDAIARYPVLVFVHGESYEWSSGNPYDGAVLASHAGLVVVTINYRLGVLGEWNIFIRPEEEFPHSIEVFWCNYRFSTTFFKFIHKHRPPTTKLTKPVIVLFDGASSPKVEYDILQGDATNLDGNLELRVRGVSGDYFSACSDFRDGVLVLERTKEYTSLEKAGDYCGSWVIAKSRPQMRRQRVVRLLGI